MAPQKKRKRRLNREELRQTIAPTKDFEFVNPNDEDDIIIVTAQRLSPGHLFEMNSSSLIEAYQQNPDALPKPNPEEDEPHTPVEVPQDVLDNLDLIVGNIKYASEIASIAIVDPETGERIYTQEDCMLFLLPAWNTEVANWALMGAAPQQGEDADTADRLSAEPEQQEESEVAAETG